MNCSRRPSFAVLVALTTAVITALCAGNDSRADQPATPVAHTAAATAPVSHFQDINVQVEGSGPALIFIPGLNSASGTFTETCAAFRSTHTCHLLHLPGFAGNAPINGVENGFMIAMRDRVIAYIKAHDLKQPVLVGHSLGGALSLMIALKEPELAGKLVIVDSLPYFAAIQNPAATPDAVRPMADNMRKMMLAQAPEQYRAGLKQNLAGMSRLPERMPTLVQWGESSDRATTAQAMYDLMTIDLRNDIASIRTPTLVLGAWAAYAPFGASKASTEAIFRTQYAKLAGVDIRLSDTGYHFLSWDDPQWLTQQLAQFLGR